MLWYAPMSCFLFVIKLAQSKSLCSAKMNPKKGPLQSSHKTWQYHHSMPASVTILDSSEQTVLVSFAILAWLNTIGMCIEKESTNLTSFWRPKNETWAWVPCLPRNVLQQRRPLCCATNNVTFLPMVVPCSPKCCFMQTWIRSGNLTKTECYLQSNKTNNHTCNENMPITTTSVADNTCNNMQWAAPTKLMTQRSMEKRHNLFH